MRTLASVLLGASIVAATCHAQADKGDPVAMADAPHPALQIDFERSPLPTQNLAQNFSTFAWSPDDESLAGGKGMEFVNPGGSQWIEGLLVLWSPSTGRMRQCLPPHAQPIRWIEFDATGRRIASASWKVELSHTVTGVVRSWDARTGRLLKESPIDFTPAGELKISPGGKTFFAIRSTWSHAQTLRAFDVIPAGPKDEALPKNVFRLIATDIGAKTPKWSVDGVDPFGSGFAIDGAGDRIAWIAYDDEAKPPQRTLTISSAERGETLLQMPLGSFEGRARDVFFVPDDDALICFGDGVATTIDLKTASIVRTLTGIQQGSGTLSADGRSFYVVADDTNRVELWDLDTGVRLGAVEAPPSVQFRMSPVQLLAASPKQGVFASSDGGIPEIVKFKRGSAAARAAAGRWSAERQIAPDAAALRPPVIDDPAEAHEATELGRLRVVTEEPLKADAGVEVSYDLRNVSDSRIEQPWVGIVQHWLVDRRPGVRPDRVRRGVGGAEVRLADDLDPGESERFTHRFSFPGPGEYRLEVEFFRHELPTRQTKSIDVRVE